ncbi:GntR family transcriptional regulator [Rhizobium nepotum]|uniref:GntR family transcriptional regulator n=1 Tax=Rhizobium nepotum TaxID=1035271 RepID=UPI003CEDFEAE
MARIEPNRGAIVTSLSLNEVLEMLDIRIALECHALRLAIPIMAEEDLAHAESILEAYNDDPDPASWGSVNWRFHTTLYEPCHSPALAADDRSEQRACPTVSSGFRFLSPLGRNGRSRNTMR